MPSTFLPFSYRIEWHAITSPLAASSFTCRRTFDKEMPVANAISASNCSPWFFQVLQDFIHNLNQSALGFVENYIARPSLAKLDCDEADNAFLMH